MLELLAYVYIIRIAQKKNEKKRKRNEKMTHVNGPLLIDSDLYSSISYYDIIIVTNCFHYK